MCVRFLSDDELDIYSAALSSLAYDNDDDGGGDDDDDDDDDVFSSCCAC